MPPAPIFTAQQLHALTSAQKNPQQAQKPQQVQQRLSKNMPFKRVYYKSLRQGSLIYGQYLFWKHDPSPLILVTGVFGDKITGVNLHYLTFKYVKTLLSMHCGKAGFSYGFIKHDPYIVNAFRTYKKAGLRNIQQLDCDSINLQFQDQRKAYKYNPQEIKAIRDILQQQLQRMANPTASQLANQSNTQTGQMPQVMPMSSQQPRPATIPTQPATR